MRRLALLLLLLALTLPALAEETEPLFPAKGENGLWGYINARAEWVIAPQFFGAYDFRGDYAIAIDLPEGLSPEEQAGFIFDSDCQGIIDRSGNWVLPPEYAIDPGYGAGFYGGEHAGIWSVTKYGEPALEGFFDIPSGCFSGLRWPAIGIWCPPHPRLRPGYLALWLRGPLHRRSGHSLPVRRLGGSRAVP